MIHAQVPPIICLCARCCQGRQGLQAPGGRLSHGIECPPTAARAPTHLSASGGSSLNSRSSSGSSLLAL